MPMAQEAAGDARRDPVCGMRGVIEAQGHWFCSQHCADEYRKRQASPAACAHPASKSAFLDPWVWAPLSGLIIASADSAFSAAGDVSRLYRSYVHIVFWPVLLGLLIGGLVDYFVPKEYIIKTLTGSKKRVILRSTLLGFLASTCSHGCLALSLELFRKGASVPAVVSFLLASPWASMPLTLMLLSFFGGKGTLIVIGALLISISAGLIFQKLDRANLIEKNPNSVALPERFSIRDDFRKRWLARTWTALQFKQDVKGIIAGMIPLGRMMLGWVQIGLIVSALSGAFIPTHIFGHWFGPSLLGLLCTLLLATIVEVCSEGTTPLAFELYRQTGAFGNSFVFLMGGVVTDYTELGALWMAIGRRTVMWLLVVTIPIVLITGFLMNQLLR